MAQFYVNTQAMVQQSPRITEVSSSVKTVKSMVSNVNSGLGSIGLGSVGPALTAIEGRLLIQAGKLQSLSANLNSVMLKYVAAESEIMGIPLFLNPDFYEILSTGIQNGKTSLVSSLTDGWPSLPSGLISKTESALLTFEELFWDGNGRLYERYGIEKTSEGLGIMPGSMGFAENKYGTREGFDNPYFDQADTLHMVEYGGSISRSYWDMGVDASGRFGHGDASISTLNREAHALVYAGLFSEDGKFAPGIGAEAGASFTAFHAEANGVFGSDYLGLYGKGEVNVGKVGAEASISAGLYDGDGNWNPSLGAGVELEAVLAEASGSAGVRVMGTDIGVQGGVGVGAGAHANIGLQDGVLSLELGAYLGIGGEVGVEIDFSDTYDTIVSAYDTVKEGAAEAIDWVGDRASEAADWVGDRVSDVGDALDSAGDWVGDRLSDFGSWTGWW